MMKSRRWIFSDICSIGDIRDYSYLSLGDLSGDCVLPA
jgi:hypothetical protein